MASEHKSKTNLLGMSRAALERWIEELGEKPFHARQIMRWVHTRGVTDFDAMTDLSRSLRARLAELAVIEPPRTITTRRSGDDTTKWMLRAGGGQAIEMVFIPEASRGTLCISSQVGCALDCSFCATGAQGFNRNLSAAEIVGQVWLAHRDLDAFGKKKRVISNVVFMGMGEPLANYRNLLPALSLLQDDYGYELSRRRVTVSTSGLVPQIGRLAQDTNVALAVSLHAANDELRNELVPINKRHPIRELLAACWDYRARTGLQSITFEYTMIDDVNDSLHDARELAQLLRDRPAKVNLIPFNPFPGTAYRRSPDRKINAFCRALLAEGVRATTRRTRGEDIDAACGQLAGRVNDRVVTRLGNKPIRVVAM